MPARRITFSAKDQPGRPIVLKGNRTTVVLTDNKCGELLLVNHEFAGGIVGIPISKHSLASKMWKKGVLVT